MRLSKRARRRSDRERKIKQAERVYKRQGMGEINLVEVGVPDIQDWARRNYNHLHRCSCYMCGHRRKWEGITLQERRSLLAMTDG